MSTRDVMLVGSVPLKPASSVFDCVCRHGLAPLMRRIPDGEQGGWGGSSTFLENPAFEPFGPKLKVTTRPTTFFDQIDLQLRRPKAGSDTANIDVGEFGIAQNAKRSYAEFKKFKNEGKFRADTRFCVTFMGPGTKFGFIVMPVEQFHPLMEKAFKAEIERVLQIVPANELTIQFDLAGEVEIEEYRRRPQSFQLPVFEQTQKYWELGPTTSMLANIVNAIPPEVEVGFHLCAIYHIDESQGQDLNVHVDYANMLSEKIKRPIGYIHIPTVPTHNENDFEALKRLRLHPETKLFIGLIHLQDGVEGAQRRLRAAAKSYPNFGIATFCGLAQPSRQEYAQPHSVDDIFEIHRKVAET